VPVLSLQVQVCVDLLLMSQSYVDIASLSVVPRITGGQVWTDALLP
jgi:protein transport protein SEC24